MTDTNHSSVAEQQENDMVMNPDLQQASLPIEKWTIESETLTYKTLATVGDFECRVFYRKEEYDPDRSFNGEKPVILVCSTSWLDDEGENKLHRYMVQTRAVYVNVVVRSTGVISSNRDVRDAVRYLSGEVKRYNGDNGKIQVVDINDNDKVYEMSYDDINLSLDVTSDTSNPQTLGQMYPVDSYTSNDVGGGSISLSYNSIFQNGTIAMSELNNKLGGGHRISGYYRGGSAVANVGNNGSIPTSGTIKFSDFRNMTDTVNGHCNGNFGHLKSRWDIFGDSTWTSNLNKMVKMSGHCGVTDPNQPAIRFNNSGGGNIIGLEMVASGRIWGYSGQPGGQGGLTSGGNGGYAIHMAVPTKISDGDWNDRIKGGGGGGGGGGTGGQGGGGGHGGTKRCNSRFCWSTKRVCYNNGGAGGAGGAGGQGGHGHGYQWDGSVWVDTHGAGWGGGNAGSGGSGGGTNAGAGGQGGTGGGGGGHQNGGGTGGTGNRGADGGSDNRGCGYHSNRTGQNGTGGHGGGSAPGKHTTSHNGGRYS